MPTTAMGSLLEELDQLLREYAMRGPIGRTAAVVTSEAGTIALPGIPGRAGPAASAAAVNGDARAGPWPRSRTAVGVAAGRGRAVTS
ncbi:hypothetical protein GCM10010220_13690 [Streptomyces parvulus]|nr:hypothetical protein GCM10010220_13690 [Streptomyces parvulus]